MYRRLGFIALASLALLACGDWSQELSNGCNVVRVSAGRVLITGPGEVPEILAGPNVEGYAVIERWVAGRVRAPEPSKETDEGVPGYFLADCSSGTSRQGLSREQWAGALRDRDLTEPTLEKPSRFKGL